MKCKRAQRLLELSRPGEIGLRELRRLDDHLRDCPACSATRQANLESDARLAAARSFLPCLEDPAGLTSSIMDAVRAAGSRAEGYDRFSPAVRRDGPAPRGLPALAGILAAGVVVFLAVMAAQTWAVLKRVSALEQTMARRGEAALAAGEVRSPGALAVEAVTSLETAGEENLERIFIEKSALRELLGLARSLSPEDFARLENILSRASFSPLGASLRLVPEEDRIFLIQKRNELRLKLRNR